IIHNLYYTCPRRNRVIAGWHDGNPEHSVGDLTVFNQLLSHPFGIIHRDREAKTHIALRTGGNRDINANQSPIMIYQCATRVARVTRCVSLHHIQVNLSLNVMQTDAAINPGSSGGAQFASHSGEPVLVHFGFLDLPVARIQKGSPDLAPQVLQEPPRKQPKWSDPKSR